jgi:hypothetical protein
MKIKNKKSYPKTFRYTRKQEKEIKETLSQILEKYLEKNLIISQMFLKIFNSFQAVVLVILEY